MVTLIQRYKMQRLPRIMRIKEHVDQGRRLSDFDRVYLEEVMQDARRNIRYVEDIPECRHLFIQLTQLFKEIMDKAIDNEMNA